MSTVYGMPFHLEDTTGNVFDSSFTDLYQRMSFTVRATMRSPERTAVMVHNASSGAGHGGLMVPVASFDFGANNALGTVKIGHGEIMEIEKYLVKVSRNNSMIRKFTASDAQAYTWTYNGTEDVEWTCTNSRGYAVASYSLKSEHEPTYEHSSGCMLYVEEAYAHIAGELLASLTIMRHIAKYRL
ncbi:hypothetical protein BDY19DRAFT_209473 [Irpex rosettiformis]|uniref:Uncharacterized protein n=1 Tax=Irpex rosettiformis TaxID=378272 RepID=A0ACB8U197_9APHY|nr:hypothetical protein BDY19DRAFT_209473 [Irpex rosettiformis]